MSYRKEIDGLRALAVIPVIFFHAGFTQFSGGFVGVDVFFVISGFLITSIILKDLEAGQFSFLHFYERRARRIFPALFLVVLVCVPFAWLWMLPVEFKDFAQSVAAVSLFSSNFLFWQELGYFETASDLKPLLHTWSLAVEEQYYLLFPILLLLAWRFGKTKVVGVIALIAVTSLLIAQIGGNFSSYSDLLNDFSWFNQPDWASFYLVTGRVWELMIGGLLAIYLLKAPLQRSRFNSPLAAFGLLLILYSIFAFDKSTPFPSVYTLIPTLGTALIIVFATDDTWVHRILTLPMMVAIGLISYSAYLWHQPLFAFARIRNINEPHIWQYAVLIALTLGLAYLSWRYVEKPFRNRYKTSRKTIFSITLVGSIGMLSFGAAGHITNGFKSRVPEEVNQLVNYARDMNPRRSECLAGMGNYIEPDNACVTHNSMNPTIALYGDSHGDTLVTGLESSIQQKELSMIQLTYKGCAPVKGLYVVGQSAFRKCTEYNEDVHEYLKNNSSITHIVVVARWALYLEADRFDNHEGGVEKEGRFLVAPVDNLQWSNDEHLRKKLVANRYIESIKALLALGKKIILVYPIPEVGWEVPDYLARAKMLGLELDNGLSTSFSRFQERNATAYAALDAIGDHENLVRVKPAELFCNSYITNRCIVEVDGKPLYYDNNHLNSIGSKLVADRIVKHLL